MYSRPLKCICFALKLSRPRTASPYTRRLDEPHVTLSLTSTKHVCSVHIRMAKGVWPFPFIIGVPQGLIKRVLSILRVTPTVGHCPALRVAHSSCVCWAQRLKSRRATVALLLFPLFPRFCTHLCSDNETISSLPRFAITFPRTTKQFTHSTHAVE